MTLRLRMLVYAGTDERSHDPPSHAIELSATTLREWLRNAEHATQWLKSVGQEEFDLKEREAGR